MEMDSLEVRDQLAELAEIVEDDFATPRVAGHPLLPQFDGLEERQKRSLDVVKPPALLLVFGQVELTPRTLGMCQTSRKGLGRASDVGGAPCRSDITRRDARPASNEV